MSPVQVWEVAPPILKAWRLFRAFCISGENDDFGVRCNFGVILPGSAENCKDLQGIQAVALLQFVHGGLDMLAVLVAVAFHHLQGLMTGDAFHGQEVNSGLH